MKSRRITLEVHEFDTVADEIQYLESEIRRLKELALIEMALELSEEDRKLLTEITRGLLKKKGADDEKRGSSN